MPIVPAERNWLLSNRAKWYPQPGVTDYAVGDDARRGAGGVRRGGHRPADRVGADRGARHAGRPALVHTFQTSHPVRYLGVVVSKMARVDAATVALDIVVPPPPPPPRSVTLAQLLAPPKPPPVGGRNTVDLTVMANRRQENRGRDALATTADILRFYASLIGDAPYPGVLGGDAGERPARRPQPGVLRRDQQPAADHAARVAQRPGDLQRLPGVLPRARGGAPVVGPGGGLEELPRAVDQRGLRAVLRRALRPREARRRRVPLGDAQPAPLVDGALGPGTDLARLPARPRQGRAAGVPRAWSTTRAPRCCTCCGG